VWHRDAYNATLTFEDGKWDLKTLKKLPEGTQPQISVEELVAAEGVIRRDERVQRLAAEVGEYSSRASLDNLKRLLCI
jgi:primary-amine oxidase